MDRPDLALCRGIESGTGGNRPACSHPGESLGNRKLQPACRRRWGAHAQHAAGQPSGRRATAAARRLRAGARPPDHHLLCPEPPVRRFRRARDRQHNPASHQCTLVRRSAGGHRRSSCRCAGRSSCRARCRLAHHLSCESDAAWRQQARRPHIAHHAERDRPLRRPDLVHPRQPGQRRPHRAVRADDGEGLAGGRPRAEVHRADPGHCLAQRLRRPSQRQAAIPAGCHARLHQRRTEQRDEGADRGVGGGHSAGADRRHLRHELQIDAGIRLALGLRLRADGDRRLRPGAARLVQAARLD